MSCFEGVPVYQVSNLVGFTRTKYKGFWLRKLCINTDIHYGTMIYVLFWMDSSLLSVQSSGVSLGQNTRVSEWESYVLIQTSTMEPWYMSCLERDSSLLSVQSRGVSLGQSTKVSDLESYLLIQMSIMEPWYIIICLVLKGFHFTECPV